MTMKNRWVILRHSNAPGDPKGFHFDLLLESKDSCRTWRLKEIPSATNPVQEVIALPNHKLYWLDKKEAILSRGRGEVLQELAGFFIGSLPESHQEPIKIDLKGNALEGGLEIQGDICKFISKT